MQIPALGLHPIRRAIGKIGIDSLQRLDDDRESVRPSLLQDHRIQGESAPRQGKPDAVQNASAVQTRGTEAVVDREFGAADAGRPAVQG